jgi:hypothetical protein
MFLKYNSYAILICHHISLKYIKQFVINLTIYCTSFLCEIKRHQLIESSIKLKRICDNIIWNNDIIKQAHVNVDFEI